MNTDLHEATEHVAGGLAGAACVGTRCHEVSYRIGRLAAAQKQRDGCHWVVERKAGGFDDPHRLTHAVRLALIFVRSRLNVEVAEIEHVGERGHVTDAKGNCVAKAFGWCVGRRHATTPQRHNATTPQKSGALAGKHMRLV